MVPLVCPAMIPLPAGLVGEARQSGDDLKLTLQDLHVESRPGKPTSSNNIAGVTAQDGTGPTGKIGKGSEWIAANTGHEDH